MRAQAGAAPSLPLCARRRGDCGETVDEEEAAEATPSAAAFPAEATRRCCSFGLEGAVGERTPCGGCCCCWAGQCLRVGKGFRWPPTGSLGATMLAAAGLGRFCWALTYICDCCHAAAAAEPADNPKTRHRGPAHLPILFSRRLLRGTLCRAAVGGKRRGARAAGGGCWGMGGVLRPGTADAKGKGPNAANGYRTPPTSSPSVGVGVGTSREVNRASRGAAGGGRRPPLRADEVDEEKKRAR